MNEMTRRIYAGVFIYLAVVIRFAYQARTGRRKMEMVQHLPVAREGEPVGEPAPSIRKCTNSPASAFSTTASYIVNVRLPGAASKRARKASSNSR